MHTAWECCHIYPPQIPFPSNIVRRPLLLDRPAARTLVCHDTIGTLVHRRVGHAASGKDTASFIRLSTCQYLQNAGSSVNSHQCRDTNSGPVTPCTGEGVCGWYMTQHFLSRSALSISWLRRCVCRTPRNSLTAGSDADVLSAVEKKIEAGSTRIFFQPMSPKSCDCTCERPSISIQHAHRL